MDSKIKWLFMFFRGTFGTEILSLKRTVYYELFS